MILFEVIIGEGVVVAIGVVVIKDVELWIIVGGVLVKVIGICNKN